MLMTIIAGKRGAQVRSQDGGGGGGGSLDNYFKPLPAYSTSSLDSKQI